MESAGISQVEVKECYALAHLLSVLQIKTRDGRKHPQPITKAKLATEIAKAVQKFIEV
jgi:hypothetical protein